MGKTPSWTEDQLAILRDNWPTKTSSEIAEMVGKTRSAVMGMKGRLGLESKIPSRKKHKAKRPYKAKKIKPEPPVVQLPVPLMEAKHGQCRAVIEGITDKDGLAMVCGKPTVWGKPFSFCSEHFEKYTTRGSNYVRSYPIIK